MILDDTIGYGKKEEFDSTGDENPVNRKPKEEKMQFEREDLFADFFWKPAEHPSWPYFRELLITLGILPGIVVLSLLLNVFLEVFSLGAIAIYGVLWVLLVIVNLNLAIRQSLSKWFDKVRIQDLGFSSQFNYRFLDEQQEILLIADGQNVSAVGLFRLKAVGVGLDGTFERIVRSIYMQQIPFFWLHRQAPISLKAVFSDEFPAITTKARNSYLAAPLHTRSSRIATHGGVWAERIIFGSCRTIQGYQDVRMINERLKELVVSDLYKIRAAFKQSLAYAALEPLQGNELLAVYQHSIHGGAPGSFYMTGYEAVDRFLQIPQILTKSMPHHLPAEFIEPTKVPHDIPLGKVFSTEFQQIEVAAGLQSQNLVEGVLVVGGTAQDRFLTNNKIVLGAAEQGMNYLVITTNPQWRCVLDLLPSACLFRLGQDLVWNPMDPEDMHEIVDYCTLLMQVFAQLFSLSELGCQLLSRAIFTCMENPREIHDFDFLAARLEQMASAPSYDPSLSSKDLGLVLRFLENIRLGNMGGMLGAVNLPFRELLEGVNIIELDLSSHKFLHFLILCILAKTIAYTRDHPDQKLMILVDSGDLLAPHDLYSQRIHDLNDYFLEWVRRLHEYSWLGLHLSLQTPSRFLPVVLQLFPNILAHRITPYDDVRLMRDLLQLLSDKIVHSQGVRQENWEYQYLKTLPPNRLIVKHPSIDNGFPVERTPLDLSWTHQWTAWEIQSRLTAYILSWRSPNPDQRPILERDFGRDTHIILKILQLLLEYPSLHITGILSAVNTSPSIDLDRPMLDRLLHRLVSLNYISSNEWDDGRGHQHRSFQIVEKGRTVYQDYLDAMELTMDSEFQNQR